MCVCMYVCMYVYTRILISEVSAFRVLCVHAHKWLDNEASANFQISPCACEASYARPYFLFLLCMVCAFIISPLSINIAIYGSSCQGKMVLIFIFNTDWMRLCISVNYSIMFSKNRMNLFVNVRPL